MIRSCSVEYFKKVLYVRLDSFRMRIEKVVRCKLSLILGKDVSRRQPTTARLCSLLRSIEAGTDWSLLL